MGAGCKTKCRNGESIFLAYGAGILAMSIPDKKTCKRCKIEKYQYQYSHNFCKKNGKTYLHSYCKPCAVVISAENAKKKPRHPIISKMNPDTKVCMKCLIEKTSAEFGTVKKGRGDIFNRPSRCKACRSARNNQWHKDNLLRSKQLHKKWSITNSAHVSAYNKAKREAEPELHAKRFKNWAANNGPKLASNQRAKDAKKRGATPTWLSFIQKAQIREFYELAAARRRQTGKKWHVDHIFPLDGKVFSGLHVPWNLQILSAFDNMSKKNRIPKEHAHLFWGPE
jgi:hypothetical protein